MVGSKSRATTAAKIFPFTNMRRLPFELYKCIMQHLPYYNLLRLKEVCLAWKCVIDDLVGTNGEHWAHVIANTLKCFTIGPFISHLAAFPPSAVRVQYRPAGSDQGIFVTVDVTNSLGSRLPWETLKSLAWTGMQHWSSSTRTVHTGRANFAVWTFSQTAPPRPCHHITGCVAGTTTK
jgi:F-box associated protein